MSVVGTKSFNQQRIAVDRNMESATNVSLKIRHIERGLDIQRSSSTCNIVI